MKEVLDFVMLFGFILFIVFMMRGFFKQVQERQDEREKKAQEYKEKQDKEA